jgi:tetratricopeptide (TPR) repeat protein
VRRVETSEVEAAKRFGEKLYAALFTADVRSAMQSSIDQARQRGESGEERVGLRLRLRLVEVPELAGVPWEYIYNPGLNRFLALSTETPLVRYLDLPERIRPLKVVQPLRVLVMLPAPSDFPELDVRQEWLNLSTTLAGLQQAGLVQLDLLEVSTLTGLQRQLRRDEYHIFHFIGHGAFDRNAADGLLILEDEDGRGRPVSGQDLAMLLHDHASLRLAVLNACEGALSAVDDPFAGVAQSLVQGGLPAVIAMQFEITDRAAIIFAHEFYRAMSDGYPVDAALTEARKVLLTESRGNGLEWGTPVLYMRSPDGRIFNLEKRQPTTDGPTAPVPPSAAAPVPVASSAQSEAVASGAAPQASTRAAVETGPSEQVPPATGARAQPQPPVAPESPAAVTRSGGPSTARWAENPPSGKRNPPLLAAVLIIAALVLAASAGLFFLTRSGEGQAPASPGQVPAGASAHNDQGLSAWEVGDADKAITEFSEAIRLKPDYAMAYNNRGIAYRFKNMLDEAIADFSKAIALVPNDGRFYLERGTTYMYKGNYDSAIPDFTRTIELLPNLPDPYYQRGIIYVETTQYDLAIQDFDRVIELEPALQDAYHQRGRVYAKKSDYSAAIADYTQAIELSPNEADAFYFDRAEAYRLQGDNVEAIADYQAVIEQTDDDGLRTEATQRLKVLENK